MRTLTELVRLAYFEVLRRQGLTQAEIGRRLGQTDRQRAAQAEVQRRYASRPALMRSILQGR